MKKDEVRIQSLVNLLNRKNLDGMVFFYPENILLGSGMLPGAPYTVCFITASSRVIIISPWWRKESVQSDSWADEIFVFDWLKGLKEINPVRAINTFLNEIRRKWKIKNIGYDGSFTCLMPSYTPSSFFGYEEIKYTLPGIFRKVANLSEDIRQLRSIKTAYEIEMLRRANCVAIESVKTFYENARPGVREIDIAADILHTVQSQVGKSGIKFTYCDPPQITSGTKRTFRANALTCPATDRRLKVGELVMLELGGCVNGYWFDLTRTLVVGGSPRPVLKKMAAAIKEAMSATFGAYLADERTASELTKAAFKVLDKCGFRKGIVHGLGHGVGFSYHEDRPMIGPGSKDVIEPGMVTSIEPGIYLPNIGGIRIEENVLWEKNRVTILSSYHNDLDKWSEEVC